MLINVIFACNRNRHIKIICKSHTFVNEVQSHTRESKKFHIHIDSIERENKNNRKKWLNKFMIQQQQIMKLRRQIKKQLLASAVKKLVSKRNDASRLTNRKRSVQSIEISNIQQTLSDSNFEIQSIERIELNENFNLDLIEDIIDQSNFEIVPHTNIQNETSEPTERKLSFFEQIGSFSGFIF